MRKKMLMTPAYASAVRTSRPTTYNRSMIIEETGDIFSGDKPRGTAWRPKNIHPEAMGLVERWKELHELSRKIAPGMFGVTAGKDYEEVSAALRFAIPSEAWKDANKLDKDLRKLLIDMADLGWEGVELDAEIPIEGDERMTWTLSVVAWGDDEILGLAQPMRYAAQAIKSTRLEEFLIEPAQRSS